MEYAVNEMMAVVVARELRDNELGFVGIGTAGRAFTLAVGIPIVAARLAQFTHAPHFTIYWGNHLSPDLSRIPAFLTQDSVTRWMAASCPPSTADKVDMLTKGRFDVSFDSAPQIDRFGNMNITAIGDYRRPKVRLVGCLAQPEHFAFVRRPIVLADLSRRTFVEKVDFITSVGYLDGGRTREEAGLRTGGPWKIVTNKCVFDFEPETRHVRLCELYPGVTVEEVLDNMGFQPVIPDRVPTAEPPTEEHIRLIREEIDPTGAFLRA
ncbi:MAG: hypothetical protein BAA01_09760 [Bacillus thermozeamaize]|uniref:CoA-transferase n=1 Tax=Bacillus thermozeamaize TaxID=230954 RepID=A0A1Y3PNI1_9BACI|nr:MAG: hypothetical protein BAA01_09760 [Bacillus thermozeamaize]